MSGWIHEALTCPSCDTTFTVRSVNGLSITRNSDIRAALMAGKLHLYDCPNCARRVLMEKPLIYTDMERLHFALVHPRGQIVDWRGAEATVATLFDAHIRNEPSGRLFTPEDHERFWVRVVFGYDRLQEKLLILEAGLDDRMVEVAKLYLLRGRPELMAKGYMNLVLTAVDQAAGTMEFLAVGPRKTPALNLMGSLDLYQTLFHDPEIRTQNPDLFGGHFVDIRRLGLAPE